MEPGYQGALSEDPLYGKHGHDALSGDEFEAGIESESPEADKNLRHRLMEKIHSHTEIVTDEVKIHVKLSYVSLYGKVESTDEKATIEALVSSAEGVMDVVNFHQLRRGFDSSDGDGIQC